MMKDAGLHKHLTGPLSVAGACSERPHNTADPVEGVFNWDRRKSACNAATAVLVVCLLENQRRTLSTAAALPGTGVDESHVDVSR